MDFNRIGFWERLHEEFLWNRVRAPYNRRFARSLGLQGGERVLEFGSGSGAVSRHLAPLLSRGGRLVCVDTSKGLMDIARRRLRLHADVEFLEGGLRQAGLAEGSFDAVVMHYVLHDIPVPERAPLVRELARLLKPGGSLFVREPTRKRHGMLPEEVRALMASGGLGEVSCASGRRLSFVGWRAGWFPYFSATFLKKGLPIR